MGKRRGNKIERAAALKIAKKLDADIKGGKKHDRAVIRWEGIIVTTFGINRSRKSGHGHIPGQLFISQTEALNLASCAITKDNYFEIIAEKDKLPQ